MTPKEGLGTHTNGNYQKTPKQFTLLRFGCSGGVEGWVRGGGAGSVAPWLARGPPKASLAASHRIKEETRLTVVNSFITDANLKKKVLRVN